MTQHIIKLPQAHHPLGTQVLTVSNESLRCSLNSIEQKLLKSLHSEGALKSVTQLWSKVAAELAQQSRLNRLEISTAQLAANVARRLQLIAQMISGCESELQEEKVRTATEFQAILAPDSAITLSRSKRAAAKPSLQDRRTPSSRPIAAATPARNASNESSSSDAQLNSTVLRRWFREHLANPFPSKEEKEAIVAETNGQATANVASTSQRTVSGSSSGSDGPQLRYEQVMLWFINARRRAGWTDFNRTHAGAKKERMAELIAVLTAEAASGPLSDLERFFNTTPEGKRVAKAEVQKQVDACRAGYARMIDWIEQNGRDKVGDWLDIAIAEAEAELKEKKRAAKAAKIEAMEGAASAPNARSTRRIARLPRSRGSVTPTPTNMAKVTIVSPTPALGMLPPAASSDFAVPSLPNKKARVSSGSSLRSTGSSSAPSIVSSRRSSRRSDSSVTTASSEADDSFEGRHKLPKSSSSIFASTSAPMGKSAPSNFVEPYFFPMMPDLMAQQPGTSSPGSDDSGHSISGLPSLSPVVPANFLPQPEQNEEWCVSQLLQGLPDYTSINNEVPFPCFDATFAPVAPASDSMSVDPSIFDFLREPPSQGNAYPISGCNDADLLNSALGMPIDGVSLDWSMDAAAFLGSNGLVDMGTSIDSFLAPSPP